MPEVLKLQPDLIILYAGHNEFYGAYGVGSTQYLGKNRNLILLYLKLRKFHIVQVLQRLIFKIFSRRTQQVPTATLMAKMVKEKTIPLDSQTFQIATKHFQENLRDIIRITRKRKVPLLLSTLTSNLKDHPPFESLFTEHLSQAQKESWYRFFRNGKKLQSEGKHLQAIDQFRLAAKLDTLPAMLHYYLAKSLLALKDTCAARREFEKARDLDALRFRAPTIFNKIIESLAEKYRVPLIRMDQVFRKATPDGIPGQNLFMEHLHPNFNGYRLMAQTFFEAIQKNFPKPVEFPVKNFPLRKVLDTYLEDSAGVTLLDLEFGNLRNFTLTHHWPFASGKPNLLEYKPLGNQETKKLAIQHIQKILFWDGAHYQLAKYYAKQKKYDAAIKEYRAVYLAFPDNAYPAMKIGDTYTLIPDLQRAIIWYREALRLDPENPNLLAKLGNVYVHQDSFRKAKEALLKALESDRKNQRLSTHQKAILHYLSAVCFANLNEMKNAQFHLQQALNLEPGLQSARQLQNQIQNYPQKK